MSYRLVATDLDGTLLDQHGELTERTREVVAALRQADVTLVLATSRRLTGTAPVAAALAHRGPLIVYDGAQIRQYPSGAIVREEHLDVAVAQIAVERIAAHGLRPVAQYADATDEYLLVGPRGTCDESLDLYLTHFGHQAREVPVADLCRSGARPLRIVAFGPLHSLKAVAPALEGLPCGLQLLPQGSYGTAELSVFAPEASKGHALLVLAEQLEIPRAEIMAIGDGINDLSMFAMAGLAVAMGNSSSTVRAAATAVTASHRQDGFAQAIERYILRPLATYGSAAQRVC